MDALSGSRNERMPTSCSPPCGAAAVDAATTGDHPAIHALLLAVYQKPSWEEFQVALEAPAYAPSDRLLIRREGRIVAHLQLVPGAIQMGPASVRAYGIEWLATLPEFRLQGLARTLVLAAEREMCRRHVVLATLRARSAEPIERFGWSLCDSASYSRANARDILAHLASRGLPDRRHTARVWRHVELDAVRRIYAQNARDCRGMRCRDERYWQWLISRNAHDQIVVAAERDAATRIRPAGRRERIVGYAVLRRERIVEWMTLPGCERAAATLLAWACREAIDGGIPTIFLHAPAEDSRHQWLVEAGGEHHRMRASDRTRLAVKVIDPAALVRALSDPLIERAREAGLRVPSAIRVAVEDKAYRLEIAADRVELVPDATQRPDLTCDAAQWTCLLLRGFEAACSIGSRPPRAAGRATVRRLQRLFPPVSFWQSPWDDLPI